MTPDVLERLIAGRRETDSLDFKGPTSWSVKTFVKDILAMANVIDGGVIIVGVEDKSFNPIGLTEDQIRSFDIDTMKDQVASFADPHVTFHCEALQDGEGRRYIVIEIAPFAEIPVVCSKDFGDVHAGVIYFRSRSGKPASARVRNSSDMREIIEASIARRSQQLNRVGFTAQNYDMYDFDRELSGL